MIKKVTGWKTKGMNKDLSVSVFNSEFSFDNQNLRLSTNEGNTTMSWVNELGTTPATFAVGIEWVENDTIIQSTVERIIGTPIGIATINHQLVVFTHDTEAQINPDHIYILKYLKKAGGINTKDLIGIEIQDLDLGFSVNHPLETQVSYEAEHIQKVYWTDGIKQPRIINIADLERIRDGKYTNTSFDFIPTLQLKESVEVKKRFDVSGVFAPGVIQYAFTYYNKYGQESNIFYTTPLYCISYRDRGANPEEKVSLAFEITVSNIDENFDCLRIYSIQRTSLNAVPYCKRVQDLSLVDVVADESGVKKISFTDNGTMGNDIDPTELLYKGGESIVAQTMEQKDNTLFFGNLKVSRNLITDDLRNSIEGLFNPRTTDCEDTTATDKASFITTEKVTTGNIIFSADTNGGIPYINNIDTSGFKTREVYRFGIQFQYETGTWSEPIWIRDYKIDASMYPTLDEVKSSGTYGKLSMPQVQAEIKDTAEYGVIDKLLKAKYKRARLLMAQPDNSSRTIICQGLASQTVYAGDSRNDDSLYGQASWNFRPIWENRPYADTSINGGGKIDSSRIEDLSNLGGSSSTGSTQPLPSPALNSTEIGTILKNNDLFRIDKNLFTIHTPELIYEESLYSEDWNNTGIQYIGNSYFTSTYGDIDIQTKTPTVASAGGFLHKSIRTAGNAALVSGLFYEDYIVDEARDSDNFYKLSSMKRPVRWPVFLWNRNGSLNNDIIRPAGGVRTSELLKKRICNYHLSTARIDNNTVSLLNKKDLQLFSSDQQTIIKIDGHPYMGNIDTALIADGYQYKYFAGKYDTEDRVDFNTHVEYRLGENEDSGKNTGIWEFNSNTGGWSFLSGLVGDRFADLCRTTEIVRMTYKSTPHLVALTTNNTIFNVGTAEPFDNNSYPLPLVEVVRNYNKDTFYGGQTEDALKANVWLPISNPVDIDASGFTITSEWGDTYFQRYDCLKTYPRTREDVNQVVDIASFMVETHINIDGRWDRNRGQINNLNVDPTNYNLHNPVYSQLNNFFNYKIMDSDAREHGSYPNYITWSKTKENGADVDLWTNVTMASVLDLDGDKGEVTKLIKFNDQLLCFQDSGISQILYNENAQISTTEGVPIELGNSGKVQGKRYLSGTIGCSNKWSVVGTQMGVYFMDDNEKSIYILSGQMSNLSLQYGFNSWCKKNIPTVGSKWTPVSKEKGGFKNFVVYNDKINQDVFFINGDTALAWNEGAQAFTSFYSYENSPYFCNLDDTGLWIREDGIWRHREGEYCKFFNFNKPYSMTLIGNEDAQLTKVFTNLEFSTSIWEDGTLDAGKFTPSIPFDYLETWNEYQHGYTDLSLVKGHADKLHPVEDMVSSIKKKFRIWRCDIPRNNCVLDSSRGEIEYPYATDASLGISRYIRKPNDRMTNPWLYLKLMKNAAAENASLPKIEIHNLLMTYFV